MRLRILLVRQAQPQAVPAADPRQWPLSGRDEALPRTCAVEATLFDGDSAVASATATAVVIPLATAHAAD